VSYFGYDENINIAPEFCGGRWVTEDWMTNCPREYAEASCITEISSMRIAEAVKSELNKLMIQFV
jgi:hypothetical protein